MKTYIICTSPPGNSISNYFFAIGSELVKNGHEVLFILDKGDKGEKEYNGIKIQYWPSKRPTKWKDLVFFYKWCKRYNPDVVIGQFGSTNIALFGSWLSGVSNRMMYWHTMFDQLKIDSGNGAFRSRFRHFVKRNLLYLFATKILTNSTETKKDIVSNYRLNPSKIMVIHYLLPDNFSGNKLKPREERKKQISFIGRLDKSKGQATVIRMIPAIHSYDSEIKFVFAGDGSELQNLEFLCEQLGVSDLVEFLGAVSLDQVYQSVSDSLINISASKQEAFGLVNIEALSAGTPILATFVGGIKDIVSEGQTGYFFDPDSETDLVQKIELIMNDWERFSSNARLSFTEEYSVSNSTLLQKQIAEIESTILPSP